MNDNIISASLEDWYKKFEGKGISREKLRKYYIDFVDKKIKLGNIIISELVKRDYERCKKEKLFLS